MIRIVLADDHAIVRRGFRALIGEEPDLVIVAECGGADEARTAVHAHAPDVLVLDIAMPGGGLALVAELATSEPDLKLLVLSMHDREPYPAEALRRGAHGYVTKAAATDELATALREVCAGRPFLSRDIARARNAGVSAAKILSQREYEVFLLLARGMAPKQIAFDLGLSIKTVYLHRSVLRDKLGARSDLELHRLALEQGLL